MTCWEPAMRVTVRDLMTLDPVTVDANANSSFTFAVYAIPV